MSTNRIYVTKDVTVTAANSDTDPAIGRSGYLNVAADDLGAWTVHEAEGLQLVITGQSGYHFLPVGAGFYLVQMDLRLATALTGSQSVTLSGYYGSYAGTVKVAAADATSPKTVVWPLLNPYAPGYFTVVAFSTGLTGSKVCHIGVSVTELTTSGASSIRNEPQPATALARNSVVKFE